jgi:diguanylate cyclase (GGDEF)-like protein/PAS domain S-box-containing protein
LLVAGEAIGALCVIDDKPRAWSSADVELLRDLAESVVSEIELRVALRTTQEQRALTDALLESLGDGVLAVDPARTFIVANDAARRMFDGAEAGKPLPPNWSQVHQSRRTDGSDLQADDGALGRGLRGNDTNDLTFTLQRPGATEPIWVEACGRPVRDADGSVTAAIAVYRDVTERKRQSDLYATLARERESETEDLRKTHDLLLRERALFETTLANIEDGVALLDAEHRILLANGSYASMFAIPYARVEGLSEKQFVEHVASLVEDPKIFVDRLMRPQKEMIEEFVFARPRRRVLRRTWTAVNLFTSTSFLVTWHDVTAERDLLKERERQLLIDALTGIPNRRAAETALRTEKERMKRAGTPLSVAVLDIDHFKRVNDDFGHATGDEVLRLVAGTLAANARITDTVARWGGEEFLAILPVPLTGARTFCERARSAVEKLRCPLVDKVTVSVGVAEVALGETPADAIARADEQLYEAKRAGRNRVGP